MSRGSIYINIKPKQELQKISAMKINKKMARTLKNYSKHFGFCHFYEHLYLNQNFIISRKVDVYVKKYAPVTGGSSLLSYLFDKRSWSKISLSDLPS